MKKNYHKTYFIFLLFINVSSNLSAQPRNLFGKVNDFETSLPLEDVIINIEKSSEHTHTDKQGFYNLNNLPAGIIAISFNKLGYKTLVVEVNVTNEVLNNLYVQLKSKATILKTIDISVDRPVTAASSKYIGHIDFENRPKNSAQDMLRLVPGLFIAQHTGGGKAEQIFIRGFDCDHGTDVATFVDGIPVNMPSHGHGQGYADLHFIIPEVVDEIQVFKGPYSPRFGNFATGAAVEFRTLDSLKHNTFQIESSLVSGKKSIMAKRFLTLLKMPDIGSNITSYFAADLLESKGYFESPQDFMRINLFSKTTLAVTDQSHLHFSISGFGSSWNASGQIPERAVKNGLISRFGSIDNTEGGNTQRNNFNLTYHTQVESTEFETQLYLVDYRFRLFSNFTFFLNDPVNGDQIEQVDDRILKGFKVHYTFSHKLFEMNNRFTIGASYRADNIENQLWHTVKRNRLEKRAHANINERATSIYINEVFRFCDKFRVEAGLRYDYFIYDVDDLILSDSNHTNYSGYNYQTLFSPKLSLIYSLTDRTQLFANAGIGFHSNDARSVVQENNEHTLPLAIGAETGMIQHFQNNFTISLALWWMDMTNELVYVGDEGTTESRGPSRRKGIDLSLRAMLTPWLFADADFNFSESVFLDTIFGNEIKHGKYVPLAPVFTSSGGLTIKFKNGIDSGIRYRHLKERPANEFNTIKARGYSIFDITASFTRKKYKVSLAIENLFNTEWNEAQFDTESRLFNEDKPVEELHFTPGTPFTGKITIAYFF